MGNENIFVLKMRKEIYNQILDVEALLLQYLFDSLTHTLQTMQYLTHNHSLFASYTRLESNNIKVLSWYAPYMVHVACFYRPKEAQMG